MSQTVHYLDLINKLAKERKLKQTDLAQILGVNVRTYRRMASKGLSFEQVTKLLLHFGHCIYAVYCEKERIIHYPLGQ